MSKDYVAVNKLLFLLEMADNLDNHPSIQKITDEYGYLVIPIDKYEDFAHDFGVIIARILNRLCEPYEEK